MNFILKNRTINAVLCKVLHYIIILFLVIVANFFIIRLMPGDILISIIGDAEYTRLLAEFPEHIDFLREKYGLNDSLFQQFVKYIKQIITWYFGISYMTNEEVVPKVLYHMKWSLILLIPATIISAIIGGYLGLKAGADTKSPINKIFTPICILFQNIPANFTSMIFLIVFAFKLRWFPLGGMTAGGVVGVDKIISIIKHMALPSLILILFRTCGNFIYVRSYTMQVNSEDYITTAISKGLDENIILKKHISKNMLVPYCTMLCMQFGSMFSGSMIIEVVFSYRGMGNLLMTSAQSKDFAMLQFAIIIIAGTTLFFNMLSDVLCVIIDPRLRKQ